MTFTQPFQYLARASERAPELVAVSTPETDLTYAELYDTARRFARILREAGVKPGDTVGVLAPSLIQFMFVWAIFHEAAIGSIPPVGYQLTDGYVHDWIVTASPRADFPKSRQIVLDSATMERVAKLELADAPREYPAETSTCRIAFSSGTTGRPKAIPFSVGTLDEKCTSGRDRWLPETPFMSTLGLGSIVALLALVSAAVTVSTFIYPGDGGEAAVAQMRRHRVTALAASPHQLSGLLTAIRRERDGLSDLRVVLVTGSAMPDFLARQITEALSVRLIVLYASTEAGSMARREGASSRPGYAGIVEPDVDVRIIDESGIPLPEGDIGVIAVRRAGHPQSYLDAEESATSSFIDGYFVTGDTGFLNGRDLFLEGRVSELINAAGVKVDPARIDEVALEFPGITDAGAFGFGDSRGLDAIGLLYASDTAVDMNQLLQFLRLKLGESVPSHFARVDQIPRSESGKVLRDQAALIFSQRPTSL